MSLRNSLKPLIYLDLQKSAIVIQLADFFFFNQNANLLTETKTETF